MAERRVPPPDIGRGTEHSTQRGVRAAQAGLLVNVILVFVKIGAGILATRYALSGEPRVLDALVHMEPDLDLVSSTSHAIDEAPRT